MQELYVAGVDCEEAKKLADLASIHQDLIFVSRSLKRLLQLLKEGSKNELLIQALWSVALVAYVRCFSEGRRSNLSEDVFKDIAGATETHRFYKNLRDKHIAHSVNPFEQVFVGLVLSPQDSPKREVLGVSTLSQKLISTSIEGVETLLKLVSVAGREVVKRAKDQERMVLQKGKEVPIESLYSRARLRAVTPGPEDAGKARQ